MREDLGFIPLVTPTSQIVGTQAVINVMSGERYKTITKETAGVLKGEYGATPAPVNKELQERVLNGATAITCRPADLLESEMNKLVADVLEKAEKEGIRLADNIEEDALINGMFSQVGWKFLLNRGNPSAFEAAPDPKAFAASLSTATSNKSASTVESYSVNVDGRNFKVAVGPSGSALSIKPEVSAAYATPASSSGEVVVAPMAGTILKILVEAGASVAKGEVVVLMEAMKMETEIRTKVSGIVSVINVKEGSTVASGDVLVSL